MGKKIDMAGLKKPLYKVVRIAHVSETPVHLVYFFAIATHMDYVTAAIFCLVVGVFTLIPVHEPPPKDKE